MELKDPWQSLPPTVIVSRRERTAMLCDCWHFPSNVNINPVDAVVSLGGSLRRFDSLDRRSITTSDSTLLSGCHEFVDEQRWTTGHCHWHGDSGGNCSGSTRCSLPRRASGTPSHLSQATLLLRELENRIVEDAKIQKEGIQLSCSFSSESEGFGRAEFWFARGREYHWLRIGCMGEWRVAGRCWKVKRIVGNKDKITE